ncbi:MAG: alanine/glycine:cation symporter family protein [Butyricicoccaceae bacterium]
MQAFNQFLLKFDDILWGLPLIILILVVGIFLTLRLGGLQVRHLPRALRYMVRNEEDGTGEVTSFGALCTALSATIGTGNIVGVATALVAGGPGALLWMWLAAFFGMATKYAEGVLAIKYRTVDKYGHVLGGPFYYIERGMDEKLPGLKPFNHALAKLFAFFGAGVGLFGIGTFTQVNGISSAVKSFFDPNNEHMVSLFGREYSWAVLISGIVLTVLVALVVIGGLRRISAVSQVVVPFMAILYFVVCLCIILFNITKVPAAVKLVVESAFGMRAAAGGALGAMFMAMQKGIARGIFSNEAGLGSAPIAAAAAQTREPVRQGLVSMTGTFIDTIIICTMTGLSIVLTGSYDIGLDGVDVTIAAFAAGLPISATVASALLTLCLIFFAFTTILGWNYYGERCVEYLFDRSMKTVMIYRFLYVLAIFIGPFMTIEAVWTIADIFNGLMAIPNLIAIIVLNGVIVAETKSFFERHTKL